MVELKNIRMIILLCIILVTILFIGFNLEDMTKGAILGTLISLSVSLPLEIIKFKTEENYKMDEFLWNGIIPYKEDISLLFNNLNELYKIKDNLFKDIDMNEPDWKNYVSCYLENKTKLDPLINEFIELVLKLGNKYSSFISKLSMLLSKIEYNNIIFKRSSRRNVCYKLYNWVENVNSYLESAYSQVIETTSCSSYVQKQSDTLIVYRWLTDIYFNDYHVDFKDIDSNQESARILSTGLNADIDFDELYNDFIKVRHGKNLKK